MAGTVIKDAERFETLTKRTGDFHIPDFLKNATPCEFSHSFIVIVRNAERHIITLRSMKPPAGAGLNLVIKSNGEC